VPTPKHGKTKLVTARKDGEYGGVVELVDDIKSTVR